MNNKDIFRNNDYQSLKCIWMASKIVEYKLCDNNFDCENCPFDKVMTNLLCDNRTENHDISNITNVITQNLNSIRFDDQIIYLKNNLMVKQICPNTFYLGLNPVLISFLDSIDSITVSECKKNIIKGKEILQISGEWGSVSISAPMNFLIHDIPGDPTKVIFNSQWFAIIDAANQEIEKGKLYEPELKNLHANAIGIIEDIKSYIPQVGNTMMDGGTKIKFLYQLVGKNKYLRILNSLDSF